MNDYQDNQQRTQEYLKNFDRERTLRSLVPNPAPVILDVGANTGTSLEEFKKLWPLSSVHCFEPQKECWALLELKGAAYDQGSVHINRVAAGNVNRSEMPFFSHDISSGISGFHRVNFDSEDSIQLQRLKVEGAAALRQYEAGFNHERQVEVIRLDTYLESSGIGQVDLLKIDTQGFEPEVLEGLGACLANVRVVLTELMFFDYYERRLSFSDLERHLLPAGFWLYDISHISKNPMNGRTDWVDVIYVNEGARHRE